MPWGFTPQIYSPLGYKDLLGVLALKEVDKDLPLQVAIDLALLLTDSK